MTLRPFLQTQCIGAHDTGRWFLEGSLRIYKRITGQARSLTAIVLVAAVLLNGCATRGGTIPYEVEDFGRPDIENAAVDPSQLKIAPLDKVRITVFQEQDLSADYQIDSAGSLQFPLIGTVQAQGLTTDELARTLTHRLSQGFIRNSNVQVVVTERVAQSVTIDGSVRQPGVKPIHGSTTLMRAVALGSGLTDDANPARVAIFRTIDGRQMAAAFDLRAIRRGEAEDPPVYGNDIIVVDGSRARTLWKDVVSTMPIFGVFRPF